ncbi:MAG: 2-succinyl-5-enolpyruvyl-6-hydroxy-3-cyclohexene-1-carboxylic-acid synthase [Planctomycetales bacterium]|nr:2-succinyl-5-enolpyruvyl-6-hydroxy-3-cyclohexene-1-carboxylic-acid synthase [Planctomycetales bacterium]
MSTPLGNAAWSVRIIDRCVRQGIRHFFVAPGSRCTPLTMAIAQHPHVNVTQHFDERALAFACLGYGKASHVPGVFICTSGTAVANALPAVVEASQEEVPMLLLTADRPPELRGTGANQTIDQVHIFGNYVRQFFDIPCPQDASFESLDTMLSAAMSAATDGPVHLNCMFREPFETGDQAISQAMHPKSDWVDCLASPTNVTNHVSNSRIDLTDISSDLLICLGTCDASEADAAIQLADQLAAPLFADVTSGVRCGATDLTLCSHQLPKPDSILHLGGRIVSKRWWQFVQQAQPRQYVQVSRLRQPIDPCHTVTRFHRSRITAETFNLPSSMLTNQLREPWQAELGRIRQAVQDELARLSSADTEMHEPYIAHEMAGTIPDGDALFLGNSMPVRDMDLFGVWHAQKRVSVAANRGASGIDGVLATAVGFALGSQRRTSLILGDLSLLYDLNSLALLARSPVPIVVVVINNDGGGIFHFLPIAEETQHFERFFGTPHGCRFQAGCEMFGVPYARATSNRMFAATYRRALASEQSCVIEVQTNRIENRKLHARLTNIAKAI